VQNIAWVKHVSGEEFVDFSMVLTLVQGLGWDRQEEEKRLADAFSGIYTINVFVVYLFNLVFPVGRLSYSYTIVPN